MRIVCVLLICSCLFASARCQSVDVFIDADKVCFIQGTDSVLVYQLRPRSLRGKYTRNNYIHPLYTLDGQIVTEDFPSDHLHHRGIFWAWHQVYIGNQKLGDAWDLKNFHYEVLSVNEVQSEREAKSITAKLLWKSSLWTDKNENELPIMSEFVTLTVYPKELNYRQIDVEIQLLALVEGVRLGGSVDEKGYGGFSARIYLPDDIQFISSSGEIAPETLPVTAGNWMDFSGSFGNEGTLAGLSILCHQENPGMKNQWILRSKRSMQNAVFPFPGRRARSISAVESIVLRYRLLIHEGRAADLNIDSIYQEYIEQ